jgi:hypothetical protein
VPISKSEIGICPLTPGKGRRGQNIAYYLQRIGSREGYRRAMEKGDNGVAPMLT